MVFYIIWSQQSEYKVFHKLTKGLAVSQTCGRASVMRSPPARRSRSPYCRSDGHRRFNLRTTLSRGMGWSSGFEWFSSFIRCVILLAWMTSCTVGMPRSSWIIALVTYHAASTIARNILDWHLCVIAVLDLLIQPQNSLVNGYPTFGRIIVYSVSESRRPRRIQTHCCENFRFRVTGAINTNRKML